MISSRNEEKHLDHVKSVLNELELVSMVLNKIDTGLSEKNRLCGARNGTSGSHNKNRSLE